VTLKLRDLGLGMPAAVVLWSPCTDFADTADTRVTLRAAEPTYLYDRHLRPAMLAYADAGDWRNPYVSPVLADFRKGFPPALIQAGTREIFLSDAVRLYQALDAAGVEVKLDVYEGMTHVFQRMLAEAPEGALALTKMKTFLERHLGR
jgi:acetyl esterase/lipase